MKMTESKARFSVENPSPASVSFAAFLNAHPDTKHLEISPEVAEAVRRYFSEWQQSPERDAERTAEKVAAKAERERREGEALLASEAKLRDKLAKIEAAKKAAKAS